MLVIINNVCHFQGESFAKRDVTLMEKHGKNVSSLHYLVISYLLLFIDKFCALIGAKSLRYFLV